MPLTCIGRTVLCCCTLISSTARMRLIHKSGQGRYPEHSTLKDAGFACIPPVCSSGWLVLLASMRPPTPAYSSSSPSGKAPRAPAAALMQQNGILYGAV